MTTPIPKTPRRAPVLYIGGGALLLVLGMAGLLLHAQSKVNRVALSEAPRGVTVTQARAVKYRASRRYVGTIAPWLEARIGPQLTSAYVDTVLVRPGDVAVRGQVLATLDCRNASAQNRALAMQARALGTTQEAIAREAARVSSLLEGGYVSPNEAERHAADSASKRAELMAAQARLSRAELEVGDCVLRAPFDGEIADRMLDPGGFARPGAPVLSLIARTQLRVLVDVPETDFPVVAPGTPVRMRILATGRTIIGRIARRAPGADGSTRTIHAEIDLADPERTMPAGTTAELTIDVGEPVDALELPLRAATVRGDSANLFTVEGDIAHKRKVAVLGESGGSLFIRPEIPAGAPVVIEGRALLSDGDKVAAQPETPPAQAAATPAATATAKGPAR